MSQKVLVPLWSEMSFPEQNSATSSLSVLLNCNMLFSLCSQNLVSFLGDPWSVCDRATFFHSFSYCKQAHMLCGETWEKGCTWYFFLHTANLSHLSQKLKCVARPRRLPERLSEEDRRWWWGTCSLLLLHCPNWHPPQPHRQGRVVPQSTSLSLGIRTFTKSACS